MLKQALISTSITAALIALSVNTVYAFNPSWTYIGTTTEKEKLFLDINSAHYVAFKSGVVFNYKIGYNFETSRVNNAITATCKNGDFDPDINSLYWLVATSNNRSVRVIVEANSNGSINLLKKVCAQADELYKRYGVGD